MKKTPIIIFVVVLIANIAKAQTTLLIPDTLSGTIFNLTLQNGIHQFYNGQNTNTMGVNGNILGPTLFLNKGDNVTINVTNLLGDTTTLHWHGLHLAPENDGGPHTTILNNTTWSPSFKVDNYAATYWYHPHLHHKTNLHVSNGIAGFMIIRDNVESALALPRTYGIDDFPLAIQTKDLDANFQIVSGTNADDVLMVNATLSPKLEVPAQVVRLRILNGSSQRAFNLGFTNNQTFYQIATDGGLLANPISLTRLVLSPGERAEILVNLSGMNGQSIYLKSFASEFGNGIYGAVNPGMGGGMTLTGYNPNPLNGADFNILKLNITAQNANPITTIPSTLTTITPILVANANITRNFTFMPSVMGPTQLNFPFMINNAHFNMDTINFIVPLNNTEIWSLTNQSGIAHPFHIHDVQFQILDRNGIAPPPSEQGWKDVVFVHAGMEVVRFITQFKDYTNDTIPFMYHCHLLVHEDGGMAGQFLVKNITSGVNDITSSKSLVTIFPNPSENIFTIKTSNKAINYISVFDNLGRKVYEQKMNNSSLDIDLSKQPKGIYFVSIQSNTDKETVKINKL
ncbi:MAG TPA: multicopper oxidase domain-containing protein [Chitinophagaceae bacterium]|jgi:bilirubin oxidase|nr:multicopper oxidase domain-containing protein [Chitinophagaceae bacterium]